MDQATLHRLLAFGVDKGVSDIHFQAGYPPHYRLHGELLAAVKVPPLKPTDTEDIARTILAGRAEVDFHRAFGEVDISYGVPGAGRFRASIFRQRGSVGVVLRIIPVDVRDFAALSLPPIIKEISDTRRGLILVTGATGNGKTTTMAAMVRHINETRRGHIITIEDPIEFLFEPGKCMIIQRELGSDTLTFKDALIAAMRQDPDVIIVGEIRDRDTAEVCLRAAETGHLVISALHTPDAVATVQRMIGLFNPAEQEVARERLSEALTSVVSLRLLLTKDGRGRVPAVEILRVTRTVRECVRTPGRLTDIPELMRRGRELYGMQTFDDHLLELVQQDAVSVEVATYASSNPEEFQRSFAIE